MAAASLVIDFNVLGSKLTPNMSRFATFPPVPFAQNVIGVTPGVPFHHFLASTREVNHKTSTQFENWLTTLDDIATIYNNSPSGRKNPITVDEIVQKLTGYTGDHASDQKRLGKELLCRKREAVVQSHGRKAVMSKPSEEVEEVMTRASVQYCQYITLA